MKAAVRVLLGILCAVLLLGMIDSVALSRIDQGNMAALFLECAEVRGHDEVTEDDYPAIAAAIIKYLRSGEEKDIPALHGELLFSERENLHLKDCAGIIRGMLAFRGVFIALLVIALVAGLYIRVRLGAEKVRALVSEAAFCMAAACLAVLGAALALAIWGLADFDSLFLAFHRVAFSNDLWMLDSGKDLLVQLMTFDFFVKYAGRMLVALLPCLMIMIVFPALYIRSKNAPLASSAEGTGEMESK
ncbi:MAG: DUF1461 domain-containing protein [Clostridia bacterium]|nr:DUF1461 domain-containing protein [Clostridia bacterium]